MILAASSMACVTAQDSGGQAVEQPSAIPFQGEPVGTTMIAKDFKRIRVPASIDATGETDASAALNEFLAGVPDGSTIVFKKDGVYLMDTGLLVQRRENLIFEGNGATLRANPATTDTQSDSVFALWSHNRNIVIRNFHIDGMDDQPGVLSGERAGFYGVLIKGENVEVHDVTIEAIPGDAFHVHVADWDRNWSKNVYIHDSHVVSAGRNGVAIIAGSDVLVERVRFDTIGYSTFDIEPNEEWQGAEGVTFRDNVAGTWSNSFLSAEGAPGSRVEGVTVTGNTVTGDSLLTAIELETGRKDIVFTNNVSLVAGKGPVLRFAHIDGLTIAGNVQPLRSGELARITDSTGVVYEP
jgi:hypothetical protein